MTKDLSISKTAEKCTYRSTEKLKCLKQKDWLKRGGVPATSTRCSNNLSRQFLITASSFPYSSKNSSAEHIHTLPTCLTIINTLTHIDKHALSHWLIHPQTHIHSHTHTHTHTLTHGETCIKSVNMFGWGIFGAVWKGRGGAQELSAEAIRAPSWGSWYPPFRSVFFALNILAFFVLR